MDNIFSIALGTSANTKKPWKNEKWAWDKLLAKIAEVHRTHETYIQYMAMSKQEQGNVKDVGGFVGGYLRDGRRKAENVVSRQLLTLDLDFAPLNFWDEFSMQFDCTAALHSTHKHSKLTPRYRLIIPLDREVTVDEYGAVGRKVASWLGINLFDPTTFEANRLMFWPSASKDADYIFEHQAGDWLSADAILASYTNWRDISEWAFATTQDSKVKKALVQQEDPEDKFGIVGAFCRTYSIEDVIDDFLASEYTKAGEGRYTYNKGTTAAGVVIYEDKFVYSHHSSDPAGGRLCNAWDLVRIHKYGVLDEDSEAYGKKLPSYKHMEDFAKELPAVKATIIKENLADAHFDFGIELTDKTEVDTKKIESGEDWKAGLEIDSKGQFTNSAQNIILVIKNDSDIKDCFSYNVFDNKRYAVRDLPWRKIDIIEPIKDVDYSGVRSYIETIYGIVAPQKIEDALALEFNRNSFHPIRDYMLTLKWDGIARIDTLLVDYFGAVDSKYTREAMRKSLVAAVARVFEPGIKFDTVLTLVGDQGTGKSTFFRRLGKRWFSDTFLTVSGKESFEQLQGAWIIEMGELAGLRKAEVESIKHYIAKCDDSFRPAYARTTETFQRQCVFFGTTNNHNFLKDSSGNRRFWPIDVRHKKASKSIWDVEFINGIDQIWAEAYEMYIMGEPLILSQEAEAIAFGERLNHSETDERAGIIEQYLNMLLPDDWDNLTLEARRRYIQSTELRPAGVKEREYVCVGEVWCECLDKEKEDMEKYKTREINDVLRGLYGWEFVSSTKVFPIYGKQKYYKKIK